MKKQTILTLVLSGISLMSTVEARQISVDRISHLSTVLAGNFESKPKVAEVNALPIKKLDIDVSGKQIDLAWALHTKIGGDPDKLADTQKAIEIYADEVMEEAADALAKQKEKYQKNKKLAGNQEKASQQTALGQENKGEQTVGSGAENGGSPNPPKPNDNTGDSDDETYAVTTPLKWRGKVCKKEIKCTTDEAEGLREKGLIA